MLNNVKASKTFALWGGAKPTISECRKTSDLFSAAKPHIFEILETTHVWSVSELPIFEPERDNCFTVCYLFNMLHDELFVRCAVPNSLWITTLLGGWHHDYVFFLEASALASIENKSSDIGGFATLPTFDGFCDISNLWGFAAFQTSEVFRHLVKHSKLLSLELNTHTSLNTQ